VVGAWAYQGSRRGEPRDNPKCAGELHQPCVPPMAPVVAGGSCRIACRAGRADFLGRRQWAATICISRERWSSVS